MTGDILDVARRLGARLKRISATELAGPCLKSGGRDRFAVNTRLGIWNCRGCGKGGDAPELARHVLNLTFAEALAFSGDERAHGTAPRRFAGGRHQAMPPEPAFHVPDPEKVAQARALWREGIDPRGTIVEIYLASRGLTLDDELAGRVLRWHAGAGAMLALFCNFMFGEPQAVSRTHLSPAGAKLTRKFLGPVGGAAIMLDAFENVSAGLAIGEGVETCLSARQFGIKPTWALGSKGAIGAFPVLGGIEALQILEEPDALAEVDACADRWTAAGREVYRTRAIGGKDMNDVLMRGAA